MTVSLVTASCRKSVAGLLKSSSRYQDAFALPQGQGDQKSKCQLLWADFAEPALSTFPVGGNRSTNKAYTLIRTRSHRLLRLDDNKSAASCRQA